MLKNLNKNAVSALIGLSLISSTIVAQAQETAKQFSISGTMARSNSMYQLEDGNEQSSWDYAIAPSYKFSDSVSMSGLLEYSYDLKKEEADYGRGLVSLKKSNISVFSQRGKLSTSFGIGFPISKGAKFSSLQASTTLGVRLDANNLYLISKKLGLAGSASLTRSFHSFETSTSGSVNNPWSSVQSFETSWAFNDMFSIAASFSHIDTQSYGGIHKDYIAHNQELGIAINSNFAMAFGHQFGSPYVSTLKANGRDLNLALVDDQNSFVYGQMTISY